MGCLARIENYNLQYMFLRVQVSKTKSEGQCSFQQQAFPDQARTVQYSHHLDRGAVVSDGGTITLVTGRC